MSLAGSRSQFKCLPVYFFDDPEFVDLVEITFALALGNDVAGARAGMDAALDGDVDNGLIGPKGSGHSRDRYGGYVMKL